MLPSFAPYPGQLYHTTQKGALSNPSCGLGKDARRGGIVGVYNKRLNAINAINANTKETPPLSGPDSLAFTFK